MRKRILVAGIGVVAALAFAGCGGSSKSGSPSSRPDTFVLSEFTIIPPANTLHPGPITLTADNVGGEVHELVIVRAAGLSDLPMKPDGSVNEAKIRNADKVGEIADVAAGSHAAKTFRLTAGTYVAICNLVDSMKGHSDMAMGHVHFAQGMHATFTVS